MRSGEGFLWRSVGRTGKFELKITLDIDDSCCPFTGDRAGQAMLAALDTDLPALFRMADVVQVSGPFGIFTEER